MKTDSSPLIPVAPWESCTLGAEMRRTNLNEGSLTVVGLSEEDSLIVLRRRGRTSYAGRHIGNVYEPAAHIVCKFWSDPETKELMVREVMSTALYQPRYIHSSETKTQR